MKFKQIEYVLEVARTGSFSQAAKELFVSQPNISSSISSLEDELGFQIFQRTNQGITITSKGEDFLKYSKNIMDELENINGIVEAEPYRKISIGCMFNHTSVSEAFTKLCMKYENSSKINFSLYTGASWDIIEDVYQNLTQLGIILINETVLDSYISTMSNKNLHFEVVKNMAVNINLRSEHPLLKEDPFDFPKLLDYPFVNYNFNVKPNLAIATEFHHMLSMGFINIDKMINVDERETRRQIVLSTDAFSVGASYHPMMEAIDQIVSIPIPNLEMALVFILKDSQSYTEELQMFIQLLLEETGKIIDR